MADHPITFTVEEIQAILDNRKMMTRQVIIPQPIYFNDLPVMKANPGDRAIYDNQLWRCLVYSRNQPDSIKWRMVREPYNIGDLLWVKETYARWSNDHNNIIYQDDPEFAKLGGQNVILNKLRASKKTADLMECVGFWQKVPARFMPKWFARIWLEITGLRKERLQEITVKDAIAEGWPKDRELFPTINTSDKALNWYRRFWDFLNAKRKECSWLDNPVVKVINFKRIEK